MVYLQYILQNDPANEDDYTLLFFCPRAAWAVPNRVLAMKPLPEAFLPAVSAAARVVWPMSKCSTSFNVHAGRRRQGYAVFWPK